MDVVDDLDSGDESLSHVRIEESEELKATKERTSAIVEAPLPLPLTHEQPVPATVETPVSVPLTEEQLARIAEIDAFLIEHSVKVNRKKKKLLAGLPVGPYETYKLGVIVANCCKVPCVLCFVAFTVFLMPSAVLVLPSS